MPRQLKVGVRAHVGRGVGNDKAVPCGVEHLGVVVGVAHRGGLRKVYAQKRAKVREPRALVDAGIHEIDPLHTRACHAQALAKSGREHLVKEAFAIVGGDVDGELVGLNIDRIKIIDIDDVVVVDRERVVMRLAKGGGLPKVGTKARLKAQSTGTPALWSMVARASSW